MMVKIIPIPSSLLVVLLAHFGAFPVSVTVVSGCLPCKAEHEKVMSGYYQDFHVFIYLYISVKTT